MARNLVIVRAGDNSLHPQWLECADGSARDWDIIVNYYGDDPDIHRAQGIRRIDSKGPKMPALYMLINEIESDLDAYDYIWFPDDDLACNAVTINKFFQICHEHHLDLAQPALTPDSHIGVAITVVNHAFQLRFTNFVEIMAPCFSRAFLKRCAPSFNTSLSGWGLDFLWPSWLDNPMKSAIIDATTITHTRAKGGPNYRFLDQSGIDPQQEFDDLMKREKLQPIHIIRGGITTNGELLALWNNQGIALIKKIMAGYLPQFANFQDELFKIVEPLLEIVNNPETSHEKSLK